jgi:hypothetical protein
VKEDAKSFLSMYDTSNFHLKKLGNINKNTFFRSAIFEIGVEKITP